MIGEQIKFTKMHGCGNDFVVILDVGNFIDGGLAKRICDRHFGVGADGMIALNLTDPNGQGIKMRIYNSDGSEAEMCGNGIRCAAKYLVDGGLAEIGKEIPILTKAGIRTPKVIRNDPKNAHVQVNMGKPVYYDPKQVVRRQGEKERVTLWTSDFKDLPIQPTKGYYVGMGNPHAVFFVEKGLGDQYATKYGPIIERATDIFPAKTNVHFVEEPDYANYNVYTWERGDGRTLACGTGACAVYVAAVMDLRLEQGTPAEMRLPGGNLDIVWKGNKAPVIMTGPATNVSKGNLEYLMNE